MKNSTTTSEEENRQDRSNPPGWKDWMEIAAPIEMFPLTYQKKEELMRRLQAAKDRNRRREAEEQAKAKP